MGKGYKEIADELELEIASGKLPLGSTVPSKRELCEQFGVSNVTAGRVHNELWARNLVLKIRGSGVEVLGPFIPPRQKMIYPKIRKLTFLHNVKSGPLRGSQVLISDSLRRHAEERKVEYNEEYGEQVPFSGVRTALKTLDPSHAYVISVQNPQPNKLPVSYLCLMHPDIHSVLVDGIFPQSYCVVCDHFDGMEKLVDYVYSRGARKVLYLDRFYLLGNSNVSERFYGCRMACERRGMGFRVIDTACYEDVLEILRSKDVPDAVICPQDSVAVRLLRMLDSAGMKKRPLITGFDGFSVIGDDPRIATIRLDRKTMARIMAEIIFTKPLNPVIYDVVRVPGQFVPPQRITNR